MKISKVIGMMYRLKDISLQIILLILYNILIVPHLKYDDILECIKSRT